MSYSGSSRVLTAIAIAILFLFQYAVCNSNGDSDSTVLPAPSVDRVGFPENYRTFSILRSFTRDIDPKIITVYGNEAAASIQSVDQLPYPNGSIIVAEYANPQVESNEARPQTDLKAGEVVRLDVMRREKGFGVDYGANRTSEWEFVAYFPDGKHMIPPSKSGKCAQCHLKAGVERDFVFRGQLPEHKTETRSSQ